MFIPVHVRCARQLQGAEYFKQNLKEWQRPFPQGPLAPPPHRLRSEPGRHLRGKGSEKRREIQVLRTIDLFLFVCRLCTVMWRSSVGFSVYAKCTCVWDKTQVLLYGSVCRNCSTFLDHTEGEVFRSPAQRQALPVHSMSRLGPQAS